MKLSKGETIAMFMLVGLILLGVLALPVLQQKAKSDYHDRYQQQTQYSPDEYQAISLSLAKRDLVAQQVMAVGTLLLLCATLATLIYSIVTTNKSLALTKESVDAYVGAESGKMVVHSIKPESDMKNVFFAFQNVGKGFVTVRLYSIEYAAIPFEEDAPVAQHLKPSFLEVPVDPQRYFPTGTFGDFVGTTQINKDWSAPPEELVKLADGTKRLWVQAKVGYQTALGQYRELRTTYYYIPYKDVFTLYPFRPYYSDMAQTWKDFRITWDKPTEEQADLGRQNVAKHLATPKSNIRGGPLAPLSPEERKAWEEKQKGKRG